MAITPQNRTSPASERFGASSDTEKSASETVKSAVSGLADATSKTASELSSAASKTASDISSAASKTASDLSSAAAKTGSAIADQATGLVEGAAEAVKSQANTIKSSGADAVSGLASSARDFATGIDNQSPHLAELVRSAADGADSLSHKIRDQDFAELLNSVTGFARKRPMLAVGFGVLAGFVLSRLLRSNTNT